MQFLKVGAEFLEPKKDDWGKQPFFDDSLPGWHQNMCFTNKFESKLTKQKKRTILNIYINRE